jgi:hypothetical protein
MSAILRFASYSMALVLLAFIIACGGLGFAYEQFAVKKKSINWITGELNRQKIPSRRGGKWWVAAVSDLLRNRVCCGHHYSNKKKSGQFFVIDDVGEPLSTREIGPTVRKIRVDVLLMTPSNKQNDKLAAWSWLDNQNPSASNELGVARGTIRPRRLHFTA